MRGDNLEVVFTSKGIIDSIQAMQLCNSCLMRMQFVHHRSSPHINYYATINKQRDNNDNKFIIDASVLTTTCRTQWLNWLKTSNAEVVTTCSANCS